MPPLLALFLCAAAVAYLLRIERRQSPDVTPALWVPTIWMLVAASRPVGLWFSSRRVDPDVSGPIDLIYLGVMFLFALAILARRRPLWAGALRDNPWIVVLFAVMAVSLAWSDIPATSLRRLGKEILALLMALAVFSEPSPRRAIESLLRRTAFILLPFSIVLIKYFPALGVEYGHWSGEQEWLGVAQQKNGLALICIISAIFLTWSLGRKWREGKAALRNKPSVAEFLVLLLTLYLLGGPDHSPFYSATSAYALFGGALTAAWVLLREKSGRRIKSATLAALILTVIVLGLATVFVSGSGIRFFASSAGRDETLTGRTQVWTSLLPSVLESPVIGKGFGGFWTSKTRAAFDISGAHSGYLDVVLGLGAVGLALVSAFLLSSCRKAHRELAQDFSWALLWICYIVVAAIHNIGESSIDSFTTQLTALLLFFAIAATRRYGRDREPGPPEEPETGLPARAISLEP